MHLVEAVLLLVTLVIISNVLSHYLVAVPVSLIQAALGLILALFFNIKIAMSTDWFMLLFIAPLLFNDGRRFPRQELWELRGPIIGNAIFLVFATTFLGGWFIHWLVPAMPLAAALALAAIMSPTDPIAVQSIATRVHLPKSVLHLVSGESLINDASGLIGFKYGIAAAVTGSFAVGQAIGDFFYISFVGALAGAVLMALINLGRRWLLQQGINDVILHTVLQLITPFLIYLVVDEGIHASGVIAVVVAGLLNNVRGDRYMMALPELRIVTERTWDIIVYTLNGIIFLILGIELPVAMRSAIESRAVRTWQALLDVLLVYLVVLLIRTLWAYGYMLVSARRQTGQDTKPSLRIAFLSGLSGVRGAITVVGVLAVPTVLANGAVFPERQLMLFIAAGYVVLSLIAAVVLLPLFTKDRLPLRLRGSLSDDEDEAAEAVETPPEAVRQLTYPQAQRFLAQMAVRRLESERRETNQKPVLDLIAEYQALIRKIDLAEDTSDTLPALVRDELALRTVGVTGELQALDDLFATNQITATVYTKAKKRLTQKRDDLAQMAAANGRPTLRMRFERWRLVLTHWWVRVASDKAGSGRFYNEKLFVEKETAKGGLKQLSHFLKQPAQRDHGYNRQVIYSLTVQYRNRIASVKALKQHTGTAYEHELQRLRALALATERAAVHDLLEQGYITTPMAQRLNQSVNYTENAANLTELEDV